MSLARRMLMRMFGCPKVSLGRVGGIIMVRTNQPCAAWVIDRLGSQPHDSVLEVGFGRGVGIELLARLVSEGYIAGVDPSEEMVAQARAWNVNAMAGLRDMRRLMAPGGSIALGCTPYTGQSKDGLPEMLTAAGLTEAHVVAAEAGCCALANTPSSTMPGECHLTSDWSGPAGKRSARMRALVAASRSTASRETDGD
jgi:SAM-dependent methyltransferase